MTSSAGKNDGAGAACRIILSGFGGQGVMLMGQMLAYAGMLEGKEVTWMPSYGPEMRGGTANCTVIISRRPIASPVVSLGAATALVAMNEPSLEKFADYLISGGRLLINASIVRRPPRREDAVVHRVDCGGIAEELGNGKIANMVMVGAAARATGAVSLDSLEQVLQKIFEGRKAALIPLNARALRAWQEEL